MQVFSVQSGFNMKEGISCARKIFLSLPGSAVSCYYLLSSSRQRYQCMQRQGKLSSFHSPITRLNPGGLQQAQMATSGSPRQMETRLDASLSRVLSQSFRYRRRTVILSSLPL